MGIINLCWYSLMASFACGILANAPQYGQHSPYPLVNTPLHALTKSSPVFPHNPQYWHNYGFPSVPGLQARNKGQLIPLDISHPMKPNWQFPLLPIFDIKKAFSSDFIPARPPMIEQYETPKKEQNLKLNLNFLPFKVKKSDEKITEQLEELCKLKGGTLLNNECYRYIKMGKPYEGAITDCQTRGGELWVPDLNDPFILERLSEKIPEIGGAPESLVWMGVKAARGKKFDINGNDVSDTYLIQVDDDDQIQDGMCVGLVYITGAPYSLGLQCADDHHFVCEFNLQKNLELTIDKYLFSKGK